MEDDITESTLAKNTRADIVEETSTEIVRVISNESGRGLTAFKEILSSYTPDQLKTMSSVLSKTVQGHSIDSALTCEGKRCSFVKVCPFTEAEQWPTGKRCPWEIFTRMQTIQTLCKELNLDLETGDFKPSELRTIIQIADIDILLERIKKQLDVDNVTVIEYKLIGRNQYVPEKKSHPLLDTWVKLSKQRMYLHEQFLNTRAAQMKAQADIGKRIKLNDLPVFTVDATETYECVAKDLEGIDESTE